MKRITVRDVPEEVHALLKARAQRNRRSLNSEILEVLSKAVDAQEGDRHAALDRIRRRRKAGPTITDTPADMKKKMREGLA